RVTDLDLVDLFRAFHDLDVVGGLTAGALHLLVADVADEDDVPVLGGKTLGLLVDLGDERAGRVDRLELTLLGLLVYSGGDAVRGEDDDGSLGDLIGFFHEDRASLLQRAHHVGVVHDLFANVDRGAVLFQGLFDGDDRSVDTGAVASGVGKQHAALVRRSRHRSHTYILGRIDKCGIERSRWC